MRIALLARILATALGVALVVAAAPTIATASPNPATVTAASAAVGPQNQAARSGAEWLVGQVNAQGYVPTATTPAKPDLSSTAQIPLALAAANVAPATARRMAGYLAGQVQAYVTQGGSDGSSQLALLILDAHALGLNPASFGGTDLVSRLLATQQTSGTDKGLFGAQSPTYTATYRQGLSLAALAAVGDTAGTQISAAVAWLTAQQCPEGGWSSYRATLGCTVTPTTFLGPDTNSTALAVEGLAAQGALTPVDTAAATGFLEARPGHRRRVGAVPQHPERGGGERPGLHLARGPVAAGHGALAHSAPVRQGRRGPGPLHRLPAGDQRHRCRRLRLPGGGRWVGDARRPRHLPGGPRPGRPGRALRRLGRLVLAGRERRGRLRPRAGRLLRLPAGPGGARHRHHGDGARARRPRLPARSGRTAASTPSATPPSTGRSRASGSASTTWWARPAPPTGRATGWSGPTAASTPSATPATAGRCRDSASPPTTSSPWWPPPTAGGYWLVGRGRRGLRLRRRPLLRLAAGAPCQRGRRRGGHGLAGRSRLPADRGRRGGLRLR